MAIYTDTGRSLMAKAFYSFAYGNGTSPLWFGFARGLDSGTTGHTDSDYQWSNLTAINGGTDITTDVPPDPILYPGPNSETLTNTSSSASLPVKYYQQTYDYAPVIYKRANSVQYIYPDPNGEIIYLENTYSAYVPDASHTAEELAMAAKCNLVRVSTFLSSIELRQVSIDPEKLTTRQIGLYKDVDSIVTIDQSHPNLVLPTEIPSGKTESDLGLCLIDNTRPYSRVDYQRDIFSFVLQF